MKRHLIIYAKRPMGHYAKTRLGSVMGHEEAAGVYARLLYSILIDIACTDMPDTIRELSVAAQEDVPYFESAFPEFSVRSQVTGELGTRMASTFAQAFNAGAESVVLTGSDVPGLTANLIKQAFTVLENPGRLRMIPGVIGPAADGGYYLIGMRAPGAPLFDGIAWSTAGVLAQTKALAHLHNVALTQLPVLADVDVVQDYEAWRATLQTACSDLGHLTKPEEG